MIDDRGRVPFAVVGVLLLVGSAMVASTMGPGAAPNDPAVESGLDRATATMNAELRGATETATADAASAPVIHPANTTWGEVLNESAPFRDALRVRLYVETRERLERLERHRSDVRVTASLPGTPNASALASALDRVTIERADGEGAAVEATVENVTLRVRRNGRVVATRSITPSVTVGTPALAMHERVSEYERRLNAGIGTPGLTQRLTAQISAVAWARGWAQYRGTPFENVVANDHVELATNAATLDLQRTTIGHVDPQGVKHTGLSAGAIVGKDLLAATGAAPPKVEAASENASKKIRRPGNDPIEVFDPPDGPRAEDETAVGVNRTADDRYLRYVDDGLEATIESAYTAQSRLKTSIRYRERGKPSPPGSPGPGWDLVDDRHRTGMVITSGSGSPPTSGPNWERIDGFVRDVRIDHYRERVWERDNETTTTTSGATEQATVTVGLLRRYDTDAGYWDRSVDGLYERGAGPLSGPNLADVDDRAREVLLDRRGGPDSIAKKTVRGTVDERPVDVTGERPDGIREWILADLNGLREQVRTENVTVERGAVASFTLNPPAVLDDHLEDDRGRIVDPPPRFDGVADRARVAARAAYLDRVRGELQERAEDHRKRSSAVDDRLDSGASLEMLRRHVGARTGGGDRRLPAISGPDGPVRLRVDAAPSYLSLAEIDDSRVPAADGAERPLVARNVNLFGIPYGDVDDAVGNASFDETDRVRLETAGRILRAANDTLDRTSGRKLADGRDTLQRAVQRASANVEDDLVDLVVSADLLDRSEARMSVRAGLDHWETTHERALAMATGEAADPVADEVLNRADAPDHEADRLRLLLDRELREAVLRPGARPRAMVADTTAARTDELADDVFDTAIEDLGPESIGANQSFAHLPAGLPLAPIPGSWYATTNVWTVTVRGEYARFGVRTTRAGPTTPGSEGAYVRDGANVTLDVDGDGADEVLGRSTRVRFEAHAGTAVLVPPGAQGVGDVDGERNETSAGWPTAGPK